MKIHITPPAALRALISAQGKSLQLGQAAKPIAVVRVTQGLTGTPGSGVAGATGDLYHTHNQPQAAAEWVVAHSLGKFPSVTVTDSAGDQVEGGVRYIDMSTVQITFSSAFSGRAYLN